jgi:hypothetical protein
MARGTSPARVEAAETAAVALDAVGRVEQIRVVVAGVGEPRAA